ncbi:MAG: DUF2200 family protein, partial [Planctomycetaceae bacterium]|nr:DUF2200 family protein [Planctomycetaceae bacterium]
MSPSSIDSYIAGFPEDVQIILERIRQIVKKAAPDAQEAIKYQIPTFVLGGNLVHFAAFQKHIGFYPAPSGMKHFEDELSAYPRGKGSVQFALDSAIPYRLIERIVRFRVVENRSMGKAKSRPAGKSSGKKAQKTVPHVKKSPRESMKCSADHDARIAAMTFSSVYPHYVAKVERKGRTKEELHQVIKWLTGFNVRALQKHIRDQ